MATSRYKAIADDHDEDGDDTPINPTPNNASLSAFDDKIPDNYRSRSISPSEGIANRPETTTASPLLGGLRGAPVIVPGEEDIPYRRTRAKVSIDTSGATLRPEGRPVFGTTEERRLSDSSQLKYSLSPTTHHFRHPSFDKNTSGPDRQLEISETARIYGYWRQTKRLWRLAAVEWFTTAALCSAFAGLLVLYNNKQTVSSGEMTTFNAVSTILSFLLGINLAASMRSYAKMLRWLLLSLCWQPLETFNLVVGCDSLLNVCKLIWRSWHHKSRRLRFGSMGLAILWLVLTMALTALVGTIGLAYNFTAADLYLTPVPGAVQITDFGGINNSDFSQAALEIQQAGVRGWRAQCDVTDDVSNTTFCGTNGKGEGWYYLSAWNPTDSSLGMYSAYYMKAVTNCTERRIYNGSAGNYENVVWLDDDPTIEKKYHHVNIARNQQNLPYAGGVVAIAGYNSSWTGRRHTEMSIFFPRAKNDSIPGQFFDCDVSLTPVWKYLTQNKSHERAPEDYQIDNTTSYMIAAAIAWNGDTVTTTGWGANHQSNTYKNFSEIAKSVPRIYGNQKLSTDNASDMITSFAVKSILALDTRTTGIGKFKNVTGDIPMRAQILDVNWQAAIWILSSIPVLQLLACIAVFAFANRAIIKDDSPLSIAKLFWSILEKYELGKRGCMLKGSEIVEHISQKTGDEMGPMVTYGWKLTNNRDAQWRRIGHLDVFEKSDEDKEMMTPMTTATWQTFETRNVRNNFWSGINYDGVDSTPEATERESLLRRGYRSASSQ